MNPNDFTCGLCGSPVEHSELHKYYRCANGNCSEFNGGCEILAHWQERQERIRLQKEVNRLREALKGAGLCETCRNFGNSCKGNEVCGCCHMEHSWLWKE